jgi:hypothetical protein
MFSRLIRAVQPKNALLYLWVLFYLSVLLVFKDFLPKKWSLDSEVIDSLVESGAAAGDLEGSYGFTALVYASLGSNVVAFIALTGVAALWFGGVAIRSNRGMMAYFFLSCPAILFGLLSPQKEVIFTFFLVLMLLALRFARSVYLYCFLIAVFYCIYAALVRQYFFLIVFVFFLIIIFLRSSPLVRVMLIVAAGFSFFLLPSSVLESVAAARDIANRLRILENPDNARTAFLNVCDVRTHFGFFCNYAYAFVRLNFGFLFGLDVSSIAVFLYVVFCVRIFFVAQRNLSESLMSNSVGILLVLFCSHVVVLHIFEPDLGSYLRHLSSAFLLFVPGILYIERSSAPFFMSSIRRS